MNLLFLDPCRASLNHNTDNEIGQTCSKFGQLDRPDKMTYDDSCFQVAYLDEDQVD